MIVVITLLFSLVFLVFSVFTLLIFILRFREGLQTLGVFDQVTEVWKEIYPFLNQFKNVSELFVTLLTQMGIFDGKTKTKWLKLDWLI